MASFDLKSKELNAFGFLLGPLWRRRLLDLLSIYLSIYCFTVKTRTSFMHFH